MHQFRLFDKEKKKLKETAERETQAASLHGPQTLVSQCDLVTASLGLPVHSYLLKD